MEEVTNQDEMRVIMTEGGTVDICTIQDGGVHDETLQPTDGKNVENIKVSCDKANKMSTVQASQNTSTGQYTSPVLPQEQVAQSVICPEETMEQSSENLPTMAIAPNPDGSSMKLQPEGDDINQAWFTTKEDKDSLQGKGVKWRQGMWAKEESDLLRSNILDYCKTHGIGDPRDVIFKQSKDERKTFYRTIAKGIHRPLFAIYRRVLRMYETGNYIGKYSSDEVEKLKELKKKYGNDWTAIGLALGRSASSVKDRCRLLNEKCTSGKWTDEEEQRLSCAVRQLTMTKPGESVTTGILWTDVAKMVGTRSEKQCRSKWLNYLNWKECGGKEWNKTDEIDLIKKIYLLGIENENEIDWVTLANGWASVRSPQWLRSKWWTIKKHVPGVQTQSFKDTIAYLHSSYARSLRHRLDRHFPRYVQIASADQYPLPNSLSTTGTSPLTTCTAITANVSHAVTVDGEIFMTREDDKGSEMLNGFEMVQLRAVPNADPSQPTSYIIEPVQCSITGSAASYILHQTSPQVGKLVKIAPSPTTVRQEANTQVVGNTQIGSTSEHNILSTPPIISSTVPQLPANNLPIIVTSETIPRHIEPAAHINSTPEACETYAEKKTTEVIEDHAMACIAEQDVSSSPGAREKLNQFENSAPSCDKVANNEKSHDSLVCDQASSEQSLTVSQSLEINFSSTENAIYSHSLVPRLVSNVQCSSSQIITNEVVIPQPTLPDHILQSQTDEPAFLSDSAITVSSPLSMVAGSLGEVTVSNVNSISSDGLIMEGEFRLSNDVSGSEVTMETNDNLVLG